MLKSKIVLSFLLVVSTLSLVACGDETPKQAPVVYQQPAVVQQAPAAQPIVMQAAPQNNDGSALTGALAGYALASALNNNSSNRNYNPAPTTVVHKTVVVNRYIPTPTATSTVASAVKSAPVVAPVIPAVAPKSTAYTPYTSARSVTPTVIGTKATSSYSSPVASSSYKPSYSSYTSSRSVSPSYSSSSSSYSRPSSSYSSYSSSRSSYSSSRR